MNHFGSFGGTMSCFHTFEGFQYLNIHYFGTWRDWNEATPQLIIHRPPRSSEVSWGVPLTLIMNSCQIRIYILFPQNLHLYFWCFQISKVIFPRYKIGNWSTCLWDHPAVPAAKATLQPYTQLHPRSKANPPQRLRENWFKWQYQYSRSRL